MTTTLPPGSWPSPITAEHVAAAGVAYGTESRPTEGGRTTVLRRRDDGPAQEVLPPQLDARTRVHEYGGSCWLPYGEGLVTSNLSDQRLWLVEGGEPQPLTPETGAAHRYGEPTPLPGGTHVLCLRERLGERVVHELVAVPLDGSGDVRVLWDGSDFVVSATVSPDGSRLAFVTWTTRACRGTAPRSGWRRWCPGRRSALDRPVRAHPGEQRLRRRHVTVRGG